MEVVRNPLSIGKIPIIPAVTDLSLLSLETGNVNSLPEMERFTVELKKDSYGLGITIAGYVCEKGIFEKIFFFTFFVSFIYSAEKTIF